MRAAARIPMMAIVSRSSSKVKPAAVPREREPERRAWARAVTETLAWNGNVGIALGSATAEQCVLLLQQVFDFPEFADHIGPLINRISKWRLASLGAAPPML